VCVGAWLYRRICVWVSLCLTGACNKRGGGSANGFEFCRGCNKGGVCDWIFKLAGCNKRGGMSANEISNWWGCNKKGGMQMDFQIGGGFNKRGGGRGSVNGISN
jgi:hypothetical protein